MICVFDVGGHGAYNWFEIIIKGDLLNQESEVQVVSHELSSIVEFFKNLTPSRFICSSTVFSHKFLEMLFYETPHMFYEACVY